MPGPGVEMSARGQRARLICSALLGVLVISCGAPPVSIAPVAGNAKGPTADDGVEGPTAASRAGGSAQAAGQGQEPTDSTGGTGADDTAPSSGRPDGAPPGVEHDIPNRDDDLKNEQDWIRRIKINCADAGREAHVHLEDNCLMLDLQAYKKDGTRITPTPPSDYKEDDDREYDRCFVKKMDPLSRGDGGLGKIQAGTVIKVTIECIPRKKPTTDTSESTEPSTHETGPTNNTTDDKGAAENTTEDTGAGASGGPGG